MGDLLIRGVDDAIMRRLKQRAEINGTSLQYEASLALKRGAPPTPADRKALLDRFERDHGFPKVPVSGAEMVRSARDEAESWGEDQP